MFKTISGSLLAAIVLFLASCETEWMEETLLSEIPVVEAYLFPGSTLQVVVTVPLPYSDDTTLVQESITGLKITLTRGSESFVLEESDSAGVYCYPVDDLLIESGYDYAISFEYHDRMITAATSIPSKPEDFAISSDTLELEQIEIDEFNPGFDDLVELSWSNTDDFNYYVQVEFLDSVKNLVNLNLDTTDLPKIVSSRPMVTDEYNLNPTQLYYYGSYRIVLFKVNEDFADLYAISDISSISLTNPITHIEGGYGIFTGMNADTLNLTVVQP
ncbi:MAG: DUF4249 family protein [Bacteroidales bacterium]|nr:DUF4249 family protein [Lentimicrobiaceae bacterium]MDD5695258.1 DUF4249 family protein [Bacteroidales bacterium]